jgi:hypothetical protein
MRDFVAATSKADALNPVATQSALKYGWSGNSLFIESKPARSLKPGDQIFRQKHTRRSDSVSAVV